MRKEEEEDKAATATATAMRLRNNVSRFMKMLSSYNPNILLAALLLLLLVIILFVLLLHFYARFFWSPTPPSRRRRTLTTPTRIIPSSAFLGVGSNGGGGGGSSAVADRGLESSVISSIPLFVYEDERDEEECVICLGFWEVGEIGRKLRICGHGFHVDCIDMWLSFHSTCPLCRSSVLPSEEDNLKPAIDDVNGDQEEEEEVGVRVQVVCDGEEDTIANGSRREDDLKTGVNGSGDANNDGVSEVRIEVEVEDNGGEESRRERSMSWGGSSSLKRMLSSRSR